MEVTVKSHVERVTSVLGSDSEAAKSEIAASWRRCLVVHRKDPGETRGTKVLTQAEFREAVGPISPLLRCAEPEVERLFRLVRGAGYLVLISNFRGIAVAERSDGREPSAGAPRSLLGTMWGEEDQGTNGLGTSLATERPILVQKSDHLLMRNTDMICAAAPLYSHRGELFGAIDITTFKNPTAASYMPLALSVVAEAARRIEMRNFRQALPSSMILTLPESDSACGSVPLIAVNSDHFVVGATRAARKSRNLTDDMLREGVPLRDILPSAEPDSPSFVDAERKVLQQAIARTNNNVSAAAAKLNISRATMYRKMKRLNMSKHGEFASHELGDR